MVQNSSRIFPKLNRLSPNSGVNTCPPFLEYENHISKILNHWPLSSWNHSTEALNLLKPFHWGFYPLKTVLTEALNLPKPFQWGSYLLKTAPLRLFNFSKPSHCMRRFADFRLFNFPLSPFSKAPLPLFSPPSPTSGFPIVPLADAAFLSVPRPLSWTRYSFPFLEKLIHIS